VLLQEGCSPATKGVAKIFIVIDNGNDHLGCREWFERRVKNETELVKVA
jgi:hypothetical protein